MRLDKVEIVGFKSFCDKQEVDFKGGVTGIVGPNGCGKSNISDAISWVLGEQSAKSLRGASMEDVIFAGTQARQPVGMAEVNLSVSGLNGNSPDGNPECTVTRRLYRDGTSEYLMNGQLCRLKDVHELFMDTGLGSKAYSIIEQGKIGLILSSKPADRRALIEEAAGITKYKARRRQTQLKLDAAQQNLLRVNDIVHEVEKQLESLKRQASKARRYRALREEMQTIERVLFGRRFLDLQEQAGSLQARASEESERERSASIALESEEARMEVRRTALYESDARLEELRGRLGELTLSVDRHQGKSGYCKEQIQQTEARAQEAAREAEELESRVRPATLALESRRGDEGRLREELSAADQECHGADAAVQACSAQQAAVEADQERFRDAQVSLLGRIATLQNAGNSVSGSAERASADLLKLAAEGDELRREQSRVDALRASARSRGEESATLLSALGQGRETAAATVGDARARAEGLAREAESLQSERDSLAGRLASLEEMVATHSAFDEGVRALLGRPESLEVLGVVADSLETDSVHERALEAFMGDRLQAVLVPDASHALRGVRYLEESGAGRGAFLPLASARTRADCGPLRDIARAEPRSRGLLSDVFRVTGPHAAQIRAALPDAILVESLEDAFAVVERHGPVACVTLAGETLRGSLIEGGRGVKGLLAPRREIKEVALRHADVDLSLVAARERERFESDRAETAAAEVRVLEERIHEAEKQLVAIRHEGATAEEEWTRLDRKAAVLAIERRQAEEERGAAAVRLAEIEQALGGAEAERAQGTERLTALAAALGEARGAAEAAQARSSEARSRLATLRERMAAAESDCRRLAQDHDELVARIAAARGRTADMERRGLELRAELAECETALVEALRGRDQVQGDTLRAEDAVRDLRNQLESLELGLKERRRERETLREALSELEVALARNGSDLDHLARECHQSLSQSAAEASVLLTDKDKVADVAGLETSVQEARERIDHMGPVNVLAVEQAQELEEREAFLTAQRQDLLESIAELERAVKGIDRASRERFQEAFRAINELFGVVFKQLFGGGTAGLSLIDEEDVLESGIDVMAQPPGKRLQNVMLLSGGEKALTAIALLFAIFQYKPSPFCILDEVDAPLDDANIGRFVRMLEGLKGQTQFVLITHSRKTMEIADQLYGVTMEEPGVSKLVSVRFS
jgi:chromosome segregation protein